RRAEICIRRKKVVLVCLCDTRNPVSGTDGESSAFIPIGLLEPRRFGRFGSEYREGLFRQRERTLILLARDGGICEFDVLEGGQSGVGAQGRPGGRKRHKDNRR